MANNKGVLAPYHAIVDGDMSADITQTTYTNIQYLDNIGIQLNFTGTPTGTFEVQVSADKVNWVSLTLDPIPVAAGAADNIYIDITQNSAPYIRVHYTFTSGVGVLNAYITAKSI